MSGRSRHQEVRRRCSTDSLSSFDEPSPPYALSDVARPRNDPEFGTRIRRAPRKTARGYRVDDMLISWAGSRFVQEGGPPREYDIWISPATSIDLPRSNRIVVECLKESIGQGDRILNKIRHYFTFGDGSSTEDFFWKLNTLWKLCVVVGAGICDLHNFFSEELAADFLKIADEVCDLLSDVKKRLRSLVAKDPTTGRIQFAGLTDQLQETYKENLDITIINMTRWNFELNAKPLSGENGILGQ